jgi:chemotaxis protein methyltransferase CheR
VLATAAAGSYGEREVARGLTPGQLARFFHRCGAQWVVAEPVRRLVQFQRVNLIEPLHGLGPFDVIFCRNVLIYFDEPTRQRICQQMRSVLADEGWLVLGAAENLYGIQDCFESVHAGETLLYRKRGSEAPGTARAN